MELLCQLQNIHLSFGEKILFDGANFSIHFGEKIGLLGLNGQGKSTLFKILSGEILPEASKPPFIFSKATGKDNLERGFSIFHVPQELPFDSDNINDFLLRFYPDFQSTSARGENIFENPRYLHVLNQYESYLKLFSIENWERPLKQLSGGEQRKVALALGLSSESNLILWDEPTNHLDMETIELFEEELLQSKKAMVLISHDRFLMNKVCQKIFHLDKGKLHTFSGSYYQYLEHREEVEKKRHSLLEKLGNHMRREEAWMRQGVKARRTRSKKRVEGFLDLKENIKNLRGLARGDMKINLVSSGKKSKILVELQDIHFSFKEKNILQEVSLSVCKGDKIAFLGPNGSGKTTLLKIIQGELSPTAGNIKRHDTLTIHYFDQKRMSLDPNKTPFELIGEGRDMVEMPDGELRHVNAYLGGFLFATHELHRPIYSFSGGEKNRLQLALFLKKKADLWIFDEPTNDLDLETMTLLEEKIKSFPGTVLLVSHDRAFLEQTALKAWVIEERKVQTFEGGLEQAYAFIQLTKLEKEEKEEIKEEVNQVKNEKKLSNKEKKRKEELPALIEKYEKRIIELDLLLSQFQYQDGQTQALEELNRMQKEREEKSIELDHFYEEWMLFE